MDSQLHELAEYINNILGNYKPAADLLPINANNCVQALHDGVILCYVVNCLSTTGQIIKQSQLKRTKATVFHKLDQVNKALEAAKKVGLTIVNVRSQFVVEKKQNVILGLFNQIKRQKPGPKPQFKKPQPQKQPQKIQEPTHKPYHQQQTQQHFVKPQQKIIPPPPTQPPQPPQPKQHIPTFKQQVLSIKINQNQHIEKSAQLGYNLENVIGPQIVVLTGSLRKGSTNRGIVESLSYIKSQKYFQNIFFHIPDISILPLYNYDLVREGRIPKAIHDLRELVRKNLGILISTPQYNGSFSGIIKNAFDWLSDSWVNNPSPLTSKKIGIVSSSYLTQNQIKDTVDMGSYVHANYYSPSFYVSLRDGAAFNMETGRLQNKHQIDKLALWYQDFSYFMLSGKPTVEHSPRFIMDA